MPVIKFINKKYNSLNAMRNLIYYVMAADKTPNRIISAIAVYPTEEEEIVQQFKQTQVFHRNQKRIGFCIFSCPLPQKKLNG